MKRPIVSVRDEDFKASLAHELDGFMTHVRRSRSLKDRARTVDFMGKGQASDWRVAP